MFTSSGTVEQAKARHFARTPTPYFRDKYGWFEKCSKKASAMLQNAEHNSDFRAEGSLEGKWNRCDGLRIMTPYIECGTAYSDGAATFTQRGLRELWT